MGLKEQWEKLKQSVEEEGARRAARESEKAAEKAESDAATKAVAGKRISEVGDTSSGVLACPKCGGTQFKAKRGRAAKVALIPTLGVGAFAAPKTRVKCVTCGTEYLRG